MAAASSTASSTARRPAAAARGRLLYTPVLRPSEEEFASPAWILAALERCRQPGHGEILLIDPPPSCRFPPPSELQPSPHAALFLLPNTYAPSVRASSAEKCKALTRESADADSSVDVQYLQWQRARRKQEKDMMRKAAQRGEHQGAAQEMQQQLPAAAQPQLAEKSAAASTSSQPRAFATHTHSTRRKGPVSATSDLSRPPEPLHPLFLALPPPLRRLHDPLSIRAYIEAQRIKHAYASSSPGSSLEGDAAAVEDDAPSSKTAAQRVKHADTATISSEPADEPALVNFDIARWTPAAAGVHRIVDTPPAPDPDPSPDAHIRYAKNVGYVRLIRPQQLHAQQPVTGRTRGASASAAAPLEPYEPADPLQQLAGTPIHPWHHHNLLSLMTAEYASKRSVQAEKESMRAPAAAHSRASASSSTSSSKAAGSPDSDEEEEEDEIDTSALDTSGSGVLEPTLYCGSRGSITSMHAENDQLSSSHHLSAGVKVWYSISATQSNVRTLMSFMRSLQWQCSMVGVSRAEDARDLAKYAQEKQLGTEDVDFGLRSHSFFFCPQALMDLGLDVHVTVQSPSAPLVLTAGCLHQIINLTAVEGWSCNFLPPCMLDVVDGVRRERDMGWHWNYPEATSLLSLSWRAVSDPSVPVVMRHACARVLLPAIELELQHRAVLFASPASPVSAEEGDDEDEAPRSGSRKRVAASRGPRPVAEGADLPFDLPLPVRLPPRSYPELCQFCQNLSFFSAIYASTSGDGSAEPSSSSTSSSRSSSPPAAGSTRSGSDASSSPEVGSSSFSASTQAAGADAVHLCCTSCLVKFLRLRSEFSADTVDAKRKRRKAGGVAIGAVSSRRGGASKPTTWGEAGKLPTDAELQRQFMRTVAFALSRHASAWSRAFVGQRCAPQDMERVRAVCVEQIGGRGGGGGGGCGNEHQRACALS